jgi:hypothetical protein
VNEVEDMAKVHDRGGWPTNEPIDMTEHELADWEWDTYTLLGLLVPKGVMTTDELRRGIEALSADEYESLNYYERWSASIESIVAGKGLLTEDEIDAKVAELEQRWG